MSDYSQSATVTRALLSTHEALVAAEAEREIASMGASLDRVALDAPPERRDVTGHAVLARLRAKRAEAATTTRAARPAPARCRTLTSGALDFTVESDPIDSTTAFARSDAGDASLEVAAAAGALRGQAYPAAGQFLLEYNRSTASLGAAVPIDPVDTHVVVEARVLEVHVRLRLELVLPGGFETEGDARLLPVVLPGSRSLPLRGTAVAWCRALLSIVGTRSPGSASTTTLASAWANQDGHDLNPASAESSFTLTHSVVISPTLRVAGVFVDLTALAAAEKSDDPWMSALAALVCRTDEGFPALDVSPPPMRVRVEPEAAWFRLCSLPQVVE